MINVTILNTHVQFFVRRPCERSLSHPAALQTELEGIAIKGLFCLVTMRLPVRFTGSTRTPDRNRERA